MQDYTFVQIMSRTTVVGIYFRLCRSLKCRVVTRTEFTLGAWVWYSLGTNVNTPFFQVPTLEFGHGAVAWAQGLTKWTPGCHVHTTFVSCGQSTALFSLLSSCFKLDSDRAKCSTYVHSHKLGTQSVNTTPFCASTHGSQAPSVDSHAKQADWQLDIIL